jgi:hypothetical protein
LKKFANLFSILIISGLSACTTLTTEKNKTFPEVMHLDSFEQTAFVPALESEIDLDKNNVYAASLLMAWDEIKKELESPLDIVSGDVLKLMNRSKTGQHVLKEDEYSTSVEVIDLTIIAKAYFKKSLPFGTPMKRDETSLLFEGKEMASFGFWGYHEASKIIYYNNDIDYALSLFPKDEDHEIMLMKTDFRRYKTMNEAVISLFNKEKIFREQKNRKNYWKYFFNDEDRVRIPIVLFNIENSYEDVEGSIFNAGTKEYSIQTAYQRTAFLLNEKGAEVESEAWLEAATEEAVEEEKPKPKKLYFDKDYLILLKRKTSNNPYFALLVTNSELMEEFSDKSEKIK